MVNLKQYNNERWDQWSCKSDPTVGAVRLSVESQKSALYRQMNFTEGK